MFKINFYTTMLASFFLLISSSIQLTADNLEKVPPHLYANGNLILSSPDSDFREDVYEMIAAKEDLGFTVIIADVWKGQEHFHLEKVENYTVISGVLEVSLNGVTSILYPGDSLNILPGTVHTARSLIDNQPARLIATCTPPWEFRDHHFVSLEGLPDLSAISRVVTADTNLPLMPIKQNLYYGFDSSTGHDNYHIICDKDNLGCQLSIVDINIKDQQPLQVTSTAIKCYIVIAGEVDIQDAQKTSKLCSGDFYRVAEKAEHSLRNLNHAPARLLEISIPK